MVLESKGIYFTLLYPVDGWQPANERSFLHEFVKRPQIQEVRISCVVLSTWSREMMRYSFGLPHPGFESQMKVYFGIPY